MNYRNRQENKFTAVYENELIKTHGELSHGARRYKFVTLRTSQGMVYDAIRVYNGETFIKQLLFEPTITRSLGELLINKD